MDKILFIGDMNVYSKDYVKAQSLKQLGYDILTLTHTPINQTDLDYVQRTIFHRMMWKLGFHLDDQHVNSKMLTAIAEFKPNILWICKGNMIKPKILKTVKEKYPALCLVSSTEDNMYKLVNRTWYYTFGLKYYDIVFTTKTHNCNSLELPSLGAKRVIMVDKGYDPDRHYPYPLTTDDLKKYSADVSFIGSCEKPRSQSIQFLAENAIKVRVWGNGWNHLKEIHENMMIEGRPVINSDQGLACTKAICASKINLCFLRKMNDDLHSDRSVEIPACGAFMLAERTSDHLRLFKENVEAVYFDSNEELLGKVRYYLSHEEGRKAIAAAGRNRCVRDDYSNIGRLKFMMTKIEEVKK